MPPSCVYPGCGIKAKKFHKETFHDLPFRYNDTELLLQWLVVLKMDITTPLETLKRKRYRVCSRHFYDDDFQYPSKAKDPKNPMRVHLKRNAIPRVGPPTADIVEVIVDESVMIGLPQSNPTESCDTSVIQSASTSLSSGLILSLISPESAVVRPCTPRSLSDTSLARPTTWNLPKESGPTSPSCPPHYAAPVKIKKEEEEEEEDSLHEMSASIGEGRLDNFKVDPKDEGYEPPCDTSPSSPSGSTSTSSHGSMNGCSERKWIVDESSIMQMFQTCCRCGLPMEERNMTKNGSQLKIRWTCLQGHKGLWQSCPDQRKVGQNNILTSAAI
ncbi:hypothetical protein UPYG_G00051050 [Umbra pygmaea]|uniref:THAP-type domain-containing protein n=1 Tax=Umbra pygmaea TaxID=75934 RepID=A0ABD0X734_UMBPY